MILAKFVAAMLDIAFFTLVLAFLISQDETEKKGNPIATAVFILMEICFAVNAGVIFMLYGEPNVVSIHNTNSPVHHTD